MRSVRDRVVVVTGGASGIGLALARRFHAEGARLVLSDVDADTLAEAVETLGGPVAGVVGVRADVTSPRSMEQLRAAALAAHGAVDVVCLNAGVVATGPLLSTSMASWRWMLDVNVMGVVHGVAAFAPGLVAQGGGHVVVTASAGGIMNAPGLGAYGATKHAVVGLAANLHDELAPLGVGVSVLCPGVIRTPPCSAGTPGARGGWRARRTPTARRERCTTASSPQRPAPTSSPRRRCGPCWRSGCSCSPARRSAGS